MIIGTSDSAEAVSAILLSNCYMFGRLCFTAKIESVSGKLIFTCLNIKYN